MPSLIRICLLLIALAGVARVSGEVLTTAEELHGLPPHRAAQGLKVRIAGVVTSIRGAEYPEFTMQDETGGLVAQLNGPVGAQVRAGQRVEIEGTTSPQSPAPRVLVSRLTTGPVVGLPEPLPVKAADLEGGAKDCLYVELSGVIRRSRIETDIQPTRLVLDLGPSARRLHVWVSYFDEALQARLQPDAAVTVRGICNSWRSPNAQPFSTFLVVADPSKIDIDRPAPAGFLEAPQRPLPELLSLAVDEFTAHRERVRGVVTLSWPDGQVVLEDGQGAIWVRAESAVESAVDLRLGDEVEAAGFPARMEGRLALENAIFGEPEAAGLVRPEAISATQLLKESHKTDREGRLLRMAGVFREAVREDDRLALVMEADGTEFRAVLPRWETLPLKMEPGARVEVAGVCRMLFGETARRIGRFADRFELWLPDARAVTLAGDPPGWTTGKWMLVMAPALAGSLVWVLLLRRRVRLRNAQLLREIRARHDTELLATERMRLAADLHDTLSQSLSGAAMQLEVAGALSKPSGEAEGHFDLARRLLSRSQEDLRRAVWDLNPSALANQDLAQALEGVAREFTGNGEVACTVHAEGQVTALPEKLRAHLFRAGQEALGNAFQHGCPRQVEVRIRVDATEAMLTVSDDGCGFDPASAPGPDEGHFGLRSMRERLERLGGRLTVSSSPQGTTVEAVAPLSSENSHES